MNYLEHSICISLITTWISYFIFAVELRRQLSKKGENSEEIVEDEANVANSDDKEAIIEHLESRLNIAEEEHEAFTEKCKNLRSLINAQQCLAFFVTTEHSIDRAMPFRL